MKRNKWNKEQTDYLIQTYPHWGTKKLVEKYGIDFKRARHKVDKLKLKLLPKSERKCISCENDPQLDRWFLCRTCFNRQRKINRRNFELTPEQRFKEILRSCRYRSEKCDLDLVYLKKLFDSQHGLCYYSKQPMVFRKYGNGRNAYSLSVDKIIPEKGYIKGNIVLCCWAANAGKNDFSTDEYIKFCKKVVDNFKNI